MSKQNNATGTDALKPDHRTTHLSPPLENARSGRSRASSVHSNNSSYGLNSHSPIRPSRSSISNSQRLRNPLSSNAPIQNNNNSSGQITQRRSSLTGLRDQGDLSSSIGMPYSHPINSSSIKGNLNPQYCLNSASSTISRTGSDANNMRGSISSRSSPRSSFSAYDAIHDIGSRRYSEQSRHKPSPEEVFDLMEREQDAIVLKLMREISELKEDNRNLLNTINQLTNGNSGSNYSLRSGSQSRSSLNSRRDSSAIIDDSDFSPYPPARTASFPQKRKYKSADVSAPH